MPTEYEAMQNAQNNVHEQWTRFSRGEAIEERQLNEVIVRSWKRCRAMGVCLHETAPVMLEKTLIDKIILQHAELIECSKSIMEKLYASISASKSIISLSDASGVVLHAVWNSGDAQSVPNLTPGQIASESAIGTNGIGTCLEERTPVSIIAQEHYRARYHEWSCSAAPIEDSTGALIGVLNVTLSRELFHPHTRGMINAAAYAIGEHLRLRALLDEQRALMELLDEGVIVMFRDGAVQSMNTKARNMLSIGSSEAVTSIQDIIRSRDILKTILEERVPFVDQEAFFKLRSGTLNCMLSAAHIEQSKGQRHRVVLTLREIRRMKEFAARVTGAKAVFTFQHIVGRSEELQNVMRFARMVAQSDAPTLILGESGTGKELFAQAIHNASPRAGGPFVTVNCGALPRNLVQSELFGYDEGAFTGASRLGKPGKFELADNGTLFLDEIGEMPMDAQVTLLRVLQNGEVTRVGGKRTRTVNVRVVAATNRDLEEAVRQNAFRQDLFYRLNVFMVQVPPLRHRKDDIPLLVDYFLEKITAPLGKTPPCPTPDVLDALLGYPWPGNIRELENTVERMVHMAGGQQEIGLELVPASIQRNLPAPASVNMPNTLPKQARLPSSEKDVIMQTLADVHGNMQQAAKLLGISRGGLYMKIKRFNVSPTAYRKKEQ